MLVLRPCARNRPSTAAYLFQSWRRRTHILLSSPCLFLISFLHFFLFLFFSFLYSMSSFFLSFFHSSFHFAFLASIPFLSFIVPFINFFLFLHLCFRYSFPARLFILYPPLLVVCRTSFAKFFKQARRR